jgi:hypothetical protein
MSSSLLTLPLELLNEIFAALLNTPYTITISFTKPTDCHSPIESLSRTCKQLRYEIGAFYSSSPFSTYLHVPCFGLITPQTSIQFYLTLTRHHSPILVSKTPQNVEEAAIFQLWRDIMVKLHTNEMDKVDREIRDMFDRRDKRVMSVLEGVYDGFMNEKKKGTVEDVMIYGGNRYWVITMNVWGSNVCKWEKAGTDEDRSLELSKL